MAEINRYQSGELSSTRLMQEAMEESRSVQAGEGKELDWHADHETFAGGRHAEHEAPAETVNTGLLWAAGAVLGVGSVAEARKTIVKQAVKSAPDLLEKPVVTLKEGAKEITTKAATYLGRIATAEASLPLAGVAAVAVATAEVVHAFNKGDELKHLSDLDAMDVATTAVLDLDPGFKAADMKKHPGIVAHKAISYIEQSAFKEHKPELQAAADEGSRCAFDALRCGRALYEQMHPEFAARLQDDIAFNKGFQSVMWAVTQHDGEARLDVIKAGIDARDPRSNVGHTIRG